MAPSHAARPLTPRLGRIACLLAAAVVFGCAGELLNEEEFLRAVAPACGDVLAEVIIPKCADCHSVQSAAGGLDVTSAGLAGRLLDQPAASSCGGVLVPRADPASGFFMAKLKDNVTCGARMPMGSAALTQAQLDCVGQWLDGMAAAP